VFIIIWDGSAWGRLHYATWQPAGCWTTDPTRADRFATAADARAAADVAGLFHVGIRPVSDVPTESFCEFCGSGPECIVCGRGRP
jgi:hypothetical protein